MLGDEALCGLIFRIHARIGHIAIVVFVSKYERIDAWCIVLKKFMQTVLVAVSVTI